MEEKKQRILVPLDGSGCSGNVIPMVEKLASDLQAGNQSS